MINLIKFVQHISKSVLPYKYYNILNHPYIRVFRITACISIILLFSFKNLLYPCFIYALLFISYIYICYQCGVIFLKIYYIFNSIIMCNIQNIYIPLTYYKIIYNMIILFIVLWGLPVIGDTILEIVGDIKYIMKQILFKKKIK